VNHSCNSLDFIIFILLFAIRTRHHDTEFFLVLKFCSAFTTDFEFQEFCCFSVCYLDCEFKVPSIIFRRSCLFLRGFVSHLVVNILSWICFDSEKSEVFLICIFFLNTIFIFFLPTYNFQVSSFVMEPNMSCACERSFSFQDQQQQSQQQQQQQQDQNQQDQFQ